MMFEKKPFGTVKEAVLYTANDFYNIVSKYTSNTNVGILFDNDPDGICSGIILHKFFDSKKIPVVLKIPFLNSLKPFSKEFNDTVLNSNLDVLIITDWNVNGFKYTQSFEKFKKTFPKLEIIIFDHHQDEYNYNIKAVYNSNNLQNQILGSQLCCSKFVFEVCKIISPTIFELSWVKAIGIIGDSNTKTWSAELFRLISLENKKRISKDESEIKTPSSTEDLSITPYGKCANYIFFGISKSEEEIMKIYNFVYESKDVFELLDKLEIYSDVMTEIQEYIENYDYFLKNSSAFLSESKIFEMEVKGDLEINCILSNMLSQKDENSLFFIYHKKNDGYVYISLRLQNKSINLGKLCEELSNSFENSNGGGHIQAAGIRVPKSFFKDLRSKFYDDVFKEEYKYLVEEKQVISK